MQVRRTRNLMLAMIFVACACGPELSVAQGESLPPWRQDLPEARQIADITVGETDVPVELALTSSEQQLGLGYRNALDDGEGMLFVFESAEARTFWMKGMRFCLDIIWILNGEIIGAAESVCPDTEGTADIDRARFSSPGPADHVLEMDAGWLKTTGYGTGTSVGIPGEISSR